MSRTYFSIIIYFCTHHLRYLIKVYFEIFIFRESWGAFVKPVPQDKSYIFSF